MNLLSRIRTLARVRPLPERRPARGRARRSRSSWTATAAGRGGAGCRSPSGTAPGTRALRRTVEAAIDLGVRNLVVYAFSTENWSRPQDEVDALMEIFGETIERELPDLAEQGVRVRFIGRRDRAPEALRRADGGDGGPHRAQHAARPLDRVRLRRPRRARRGGAADRRERRSTRARSTRTSLAANLYAPELPDPDLLIRTSGELRVSNFMLWQLAYAELVFVDRLWPDFDARDLRGALAEYAQRRRRFGGR